VMHYFYFMPFLLVYSAVYCSAASPSLSWENDHLKKKVGHAVKSVRFIFPFSNKTTKTVSIESIEASCGCTQAKPPVLPWLIEAGTQQELEVFVNVQGKTGIFTKSLTVVSSLGNNELTTTVEIDNPVLREMSPAERERNLFQSKKNRQAIFTGECGTCHAEPTKNKYGPSLYEAACGICHEASHRASMVPDLKSKIKSESAAYWRQWITHGKEGGIMPAFAASENGPLSGSQISTLVHFLAKPEPETKKRKGVIRSFGTPRSGIKK